MTTYLVDTNILVSLVDPNRPQHITAQQAVVKLRHQGQQLAIAYQNCVEFWNVATRPTSKNGLGLSVNATTQELSRIELGFTLVPDSPAIYPIWRGLVVTYGVSGVQVHDARLAAAMLAHGLSHILTFNAADFARYAPAGLVVVDPTAV